MRPQLMIGLLMNERFMGGLSSLHRRDYGFGAEKQGTFAAVTSPAARNFSEPASENGSGSFSSPSPVLTGPRPGRGQAVVVPGDSAKNGICIHPENRYNRTDENPNSKPGESSIEAVQ
jgi:hypothetical protein